MLFIPITSHLVSCVEFLNSIAFLMYLILSFLKNPRYLKTTAIDWNYFFKLYFILFIIIILLSPVISLLKLFTDISEVKLNLSDFIILSGMVIFVPIIEEIIFRLILRPTSTNIIFYLLFTFFVFIFSIYKHNSFIMIISFCIAAFIVFILSDKEKIAKTQFLILRHYGVFFYLACVLFGLVHVFNNEHFTVTFLLLAPIFILPQIICGGFLGFIRIRYGIIYSILFHSLINLIPAIFMLFNMI
jgi:uncharacterized protein